MAVYDASARHYHLTAAGREETLAAAVVGRPTETSKGGSAANGAANAPARPAANRAHNVGVKFRVLGAPKGWRESPKEFFRRQHVEFSELGLRNVDGVSFTMDDLFVRVTASSIVLTTKTAAYVRDVPSLMRWLVPLSFGVKDSLERKYPHLRLSPEPVIITGEIAHERDLVAALAQAPDFRVVKHSDGRPRVQFDRSKGPVEIEFVHPGLFDADSDTWDRRILQLLDSPYDYDVLGAKVEHAEAAIEDFERRWREAVYAIEGVTRNQTVFDANMASHLDVLQGIKEGIREHARVSAEVLSALRARPADAGNRVAWRRRFR